MKFLIHYIVRTAVKNLHFNLVMDGPVSAKSLVHIRCECAVAATNRGFVTDSADVVICNIIPLPSGDALAKQIGGS